eukprot:TRINITY_DN110909_c0_g1_i1.p1 TRINITY_DN110909_c0_g1~~TRINITY_DN110909_c0_g1_i1.p1  ORF type:complete len:887 (+),score=204.93 TRINITY_DN110909_c0_g1_i1:97-2757(+)
MTDDASTPAIGVGIGSQCCTGADASSINELRVADGGRSDLLVDVAPRLSDESRMRRSGHGTDNQPSEVEQLRELLKLHGQRIQDLERLAAKAGYSPASPASTPASLCISQKAEDADRGQISGRSGAPARQGLSIPVPQKSSASPFKRFSDFKGDSRTSRERCESPPSDNENNTLLSRRLPGGSSSLPMSADAQAADERKGSPGGHRQPHPLPVGSRQHSVRSAGAFREESSKAALSTAHAVHAPPAPTGIGDAQKFFDQDKLKAIYNKPYKKARQQASLIGGGVLGILSMPFGPIGMAAGGFFGALCGAGVGYCLDRRTESKKLHESTIAKKRLRSLVRWANSRSHDAEEVVTLIEVVTLEFKPIADIASGSQQARRLLKLLDGWVSQKPVTRQLWVYMDTLLTEWRHLNREDFLRSMFVFQTLAVMYTYTQRVLDDHEEQFLQRMESLLNHESVKAVIVHAQAYPTSGENQVMECMIYADVFGTGRPISERRRGDTPSERSASPHSSRHDMEVGDCESDDDIETYMSKPAETGALLAPLSEERASPSMVTDATKLVKVPKKPFFRDWNDFMEFDPDLKRRMPITLSEFALLREKSQESNRGWEVCIERKEILISKQQAGGPGIFCLRAWAKVPDVDMNVAFYLFHEFSERMKWDKIFAEMRMVGDEQKGSDILYSLLKPPMVTPREYLQWRRARVFEDGSIQIVLRSAEHPSCPESTQYIRADSIISGYVLKQEWEGNQKVLNIFLMSCADIKGLIPKWIINMMAPKKPVEWIETLRKACVDYQTQHPDYEQRLASYLQKYSEDIEYDFDYVVPSQISPNSAGTVGTGTGEQASRKEDEEIQNEFSTQNESSQAQSERNKSSPQNSQHSQVMSSEPPAVHGRSAL